MKGTGIICSIIIVLAYCYLCYIMAQEQKKRTALLKDSLKKENIIKEEKIIKPKKEKPLKK